MIAALLGRFAPWLKLWPLALALVAFGGGWTVNGWRIGAERTEELRAANQARLADEQEANAKSAELDDKLAKIEQNNRALNRRLAHETAKPDYRCPVPHDGLQLRSDAVSGHAAGQPDKNVRPNP